MDTKKVIAFKLGISTKTVERRADLLKLKKHYEGSFPDQKRVFSESDFEAIKNWKGQKPGRKPLLHPETEKPLTHADIDELLDERL